MKVHISLNVNDIDKSVEFYGRMFDTSPVKLKTAVQNGAGVEDSDGRPGYAKFDIADPPLNLALNETGAGDRGSLSHLGLQVDTTEKVLEFKNRWEHAGLTTADELDVTCCYARQDKTWIKDPDGNEWEAFVVLEDVVDMTETEAACCNGEVVAKVGTEADSIAADSCGTSADSGCC